MHPQNASEKSWKYLQILYGEVLQEIDAHFAAVAVQYMPIKGAYLICNGLAEKMQYRRMDDIDILVKAEDFERVCAYFSNLPNVVFLRHKWFFEKEFSYSFGAVECHLEIHWLLNFPARFILSPHAIFARAIKPNGFPRLLPCPEDALLILTCHAFVHIAFELRETLFEEILLLSSNKGFSWETFWEYAHETGIERFIRLLLLRYCEENYGNVKVPQIVEFSTFLRPFLSKKWYDRLPFFLRKALLEIPFARNPWWLIVNKLTM
jgi:hypothetical protein